jgi:hypothetical protein
MSETVAVNAPAAAGTVPASVPGAGKPATEPAKAGAQEKTGRDARLAKHKVSTEPAPAPVTATDDAAKAAAAKAAEDAAKATVGADNKPAKGSGYSARRIAELEAENTRLKTESRATLLDEIKADPGKIFKLIDDPDLLVKLAEAKGKGEDPEEIVRRAVEEATKPLKDQAEKDKAERDAAVAAQRNADVLAANRLIFADGYKDGEETICDPTKWKLSQRLTKAGVIDAPLEAHRTVTELARGIQTKLKAAGKPLRQFTNKEAATMLAVAFDAIEKREAARAEHYREPAPEPGTKPVAKPDERIRRTTISSRIGYGQTVGRETNAAPPRNAHERRAQRLAKIQ